VRYAGSLITLFTDLVNIYAPSGAENRHELEVFFNNVITYLLPTNPTEMLLAGDFNFVAFPNDYTGKPNLSKALLSLITGMVLYDIWEAEAQSPTYTHYTKDGATRLDRIYIYNKLYKNVNREQKRLQPPFLTTSLKLHA